MKFGLTLRYHSEVANDGTGAQLQRIFGIFAISNIPGIQYLHSGIKNLTITPLDPFQSDSQLSTYLEAVNRIFALPSSPNLPLNFHRVYSVDQLTWRKLATFACRAFFGRKHLLLQIKNPYAVIEKFPRQYLHVQQYFNVIPERRSDSNNVKEIVLHIRRGSNGADILPGETSPRMLTNAYYLELVNAILKNYCKKGDLVELVIITDVPSKTFIYSPIESQLEYWSTEPRLIEGSITIKGETFSEFNIKSFANFSVIHGGDPIYALNKMRDADFLVMSRSSFSYVGALLNKHGKVFYPPSFWHKPMPGWIKIR